jgi:31-O-methyltransferase
MFALTLALADGYIPPVDSTTVKDDLMATPLYDTTLPDGTRFACLRPSEVRVIHDSVQEYFRHGVDVSDGDVVFDVGANIGLFAHHVRQLGHRDVTIYSFEPIPAVYQALAENARRGGSSHWYTLPCGLGRKTETVTFRYHFRASMLSTAYPDKSPEERQRWLETASRNLHRAPWYVRWVGWLPSAWRHALIELGVRKLLKAQKVPCQLRRLSEVIAEQQVTKIDLLKIDVERGEMDVLAGIDEADWPKIRQAVVEVHDLGQGRVAAVEQLLRQHGFNHVVVEQEPMLAATDMYNVYARRVAAGAASLRSAA